MANIAGTNTVGTNATVGGIAPSLAITQTVVAVLVTPTMQLQQVVELSVATPTLSLRQVVWSTVAAGLSITQTVVQATVTPAMAIRQQVAGQALAALAIRQWVVGASASDLWRVAVVVDGVDRSAAVTGQVEIEHAEDASGLATFRLVVDAATFDPETWTGRGVQIDYVATDASGTEQWRARRFTGIVIEPRVDTDTGIAEIICSTDIQRRIYAMARAQIDALLGGRWSRHLFDAEASPWQYALDRMSTRQASLFAGVMGDLRVSDWAPGGAPQHTIGDAQRVEDTLRVDKAERSALTNRVRITIDFRFDRLRQRNVTYSWRLPHGLCGYLTGGYALPSRDAVRSAAGSAGWSLVDGPHYTPLWPAQGVTCVTPAGGIQSIGWVPSQGALNSLCIAAAFTLSTRWAQTVTETHQVVVESPASVQANGVHEIAEDYGFAVEIDATSWERDPVDSPAPQTVEIGGHQVSGFAAPNGDLLFDAAELPQARSELDAALLTAVDRARAEIARTHRANRVSVDVPIGQLVELHHDMSLTTATLDASGRVAAVRDLLDVDTGRAVSTVTLAISRTSGAGLNDPADTPVTPTVPASTTATTYDRSVVLGTHLGGRITSPVPGGDWHGWFSNYFPRDPGAVVYDEQFVVITQPIDDADRQAIEAPVAYSYTARVRNDQLEETY